jgi:hypothetical protein
LKVVENPFDPESLSGSSKLHNYSGKASEVSGGGVHDTGCELVVGDSGALDRAPDQVAIQTVWQIAAIEPV